MNTGNIKTNAPKPRKDFISAITKQADKYGICDSGKSPKLLVNIKGQLMLAFFWLCAKYGA
jgi:hypothetical protein